MLNSNIESFKLPKTRWLHAKLFLWNMKTQNHKHIFS